MKVLGIDPGIARLGWGIVEQKVGKYTAPGFGCVTTSKQDSPEKRLVVLFRRLQQIIKRYKPEVMAVEDLFFASNAKTAFQVGQARGVALLTAALKNLPAANYSPLKIKMSIVGYGRAEKSQVQQMVISVLKLKKAPKLDDTADALAVALTHLFTHKFEEKIRKSGK